MLHSGLMRAGEKIQFYSGQMKRKQFLTRLLKISQQRQSVNPLRDPRVPSALVSKETQMGRPQSALRMIPMEIEGVHLQQVSIRSREIVIVKEDLFGGKCWQGKERANKGMANSRKIPSIGKIKTTLNHSKLNASRIYDINKIIEDNYRNGLYEPAEQGKNQNISKNSSQSEPPPHYLNIKQLQPRAPPPKPNNEFLAKRAPTKPTEFTRQSPFKRHSLTEPTAPNESITERRQGSEARKGEGRERQGNYSDAFKKYGSLQEQGGREKVECCNKMKLSVRKEINRNYTKHFNPPPKLTAKSYIVYEAGRRREESRVVAAMNSKNSQEVASLTKIMTCILSLEISEQLGVDRTAEEVVVGRLEAGVSGTTASLAYGEIYTIDQLLYGLMLPSGNDASMALAVWGGRKLLEGERQGERFTKLECYGRFILEMNSKAQQLRMAKTSYANSHGLMNPNNRSSAYDIALLCEYAMSNESFRAIVGCRQYRGVVRFNEEFKRTEERMYRRENDGEGEEGKSPPKRPSSTGSRSTAKRIAIEWENTNKLLHLKPKEYLGIKTGYTVAAGPCLSSYLSINGRNFIIIVLGCGRMGLRFKETEVLRKWLVKHEGLKKRKAGKGGGSQPRQQEQEELEEERVQLLLESMKADEERDD